MNTHNLQPISLWMRESQCSPHDIVTEGCFECLLHLCLISLSMKHYVLQMPCSFRSAIVKVCMKINWLEKEFWGLWLQNSLDCLGSYNTVACSGRKLHYTLWVPAVSRGAFSYIFIRHSYKIEGGCDILQWEFCYLLQLTKQVAWSRHYSDLHLGYVWFEFWPWHGCLEWGFSWFSSVSPGKHARVIPWLLCVQSFNSLAMELVIYILAQSLCKMWIFSEPKNMKYMAFYGGVVGGGGTEIL
jgi:hypothetical protein